jgi:carbon starvation protein
MLLLPGWAMIHQIVTDFIPNQKWLLVGFGVLIEVLQVWMIIEALLIWPRARGVLEEGAWEAGDASGATSPARAQH